MSLPASSMVPPASGRMPMIASTSSAWPFPSTPAMPSTSPAWMVMSMSDNTSRPPITLPATRTPDSASTTRSVTVDSRSSGTGSAEPTIISASCRLVTVFGIGGADGGAAADDGDLVGDVP